MGYGPNSSSGDYRAGQDLSNNHYTSENSSGPNIRQMPHNNQGFTNDRERVVVKKWVPPSMANNENFSSEERNNIVFRRVRGILNKITPDKFHKLSDELLHAGLDSPAILKGVIMLIFNKALEEPKYSSMYAQLCRKLSEGVPNFDVQTPSGARSSEYPNTFCRFLLRKCEAEFSNRCNASDAFGEGPLNEEEEELRDQAKKKMLGNIKFICELGKQNLADEFILHRCIQQLCKKKVDLKNKAEDLECLCQIMKTVGRLLDTEKGKTLMDQYFMRMEKYANSPDLPMRYRFMLQDVLDLRKNKWVPRSIQRDQNPKTINQIREEAGRDYSFLQPGGSFSAGYQTLSGNSTGPNNSLRNSNSGGFVSSSSSQSNYYGGTSQRALDDMYAASLPSFGNSMGAPINNSLMLDHDPLGPSFASNQIGNASAKDPFNQFPSQMYGKKQLQKEPLNNSPPSNPTSLGQSRDNSAGRDLPNRDQETQPIQPRFVRQDRERITDVNLHLRDQRDNRERLDMKDPSSGQGGPMRENRGNYISRQNPQQMDNRVQGKFNQNVGYNNYMNNNSGNMRPLNMSHNNPNVGGDRSFNNNPVINKSGQMNREGSGNRELPPRFQRMQLQQQQLQQNSQGVPQYQQSQQQQPLLHQSGPGSHHRNYGNTGNNNCGGSNEFNAGNQPSGHRGGHYHQQQDGQTGGYQRMNDQRITRPHPVMGNNQQSNVANTPSGILSQQSSSSRPLLPMFSSMDSKEISLRPARNSILLKPSHMPPLSKTHVDSETSTDHKSVEIEKRNALNDSPVKDKLSSDLPAEKRSLVSQNKIETVSKEQIGDQINKVLNEFFNNGANVSAKEILLKELEKLRSTKHPAVEILRLVMEKAAEREEKEREQTSELLISLKDAGFAGSSEFCAALQALLGRMGALEADIPKVKSIVAAYIAHAVGAAIITLQEAFKLSDRGHYYPLFLLCLQQLHSRKGEEWLQQRFEESNIDLMCALPECDRNKERLCEVLKDRQLSFLQPLLRIESELQRLVTGTSGQELTPAALYRWIKDNVDNKLQQNSAFIVILFKALAKLISERCDAQVENEEPAQADKKLLQNYKQLFSKFGQVLQSFLVDRQDLQLSVLYALQTYCHSLGFPKGLILRWFIVLYELDVVDGEVFLKWKEEVNDEYPDKGKALFQVNVWLTWLEKAEQDDDEEEDEDDS